MGHAVHPLRLGDLAGLPRTCPDCDRIAPVGAGWVQQTVRAWGQCGWRLDGGPGASTDGSPAELTRAAILVAPSQHRPYAGPLASTPLSPDSAVLVSLRIVPEFRGAGIGRRLVQASAALAVRRGYKGLEAIGTRGPQSCCLLSVDWLCSVGFQVSRDHPMTPRLRMDLATTVSWRTDLEAAWQRLTDLVAPSPPPEPVGRVSRVARVDPDSRDAGVATRH